jgi:3-dehydroshikimate dehydratase
MTFLPGLVSVTFKDHSCEDVIRFALAAKLKAIEWHGLNHVPHGDLETAHRIAQSMLEAELNVAAYGSYYVTGISENQGLPFSIVLETAVALGAPMIRVWAGNHNPDETSPRSRSHIVDEAKRIADLAGEKQIRLVFEYHQDSLTQTGESCAALMESVDHSNVGVYWQPAPEMDVNRNLEQLHRVEPWVVGLHVFHWGPTHRDRHPLSQGELDWAQYLTATEGIPSELNTLLEFVRGGAVKQFYEDAETLHRLLARSIA